MDPANRTRSASYDFGSSSDRRAPFSAILIPSESNCTCGQSQAPDQPEQVNETDESQITVIQIDDGTVHYPSVSQQMARSFSESDLNDSSCIPSEKSGGCLRKSTSKSSVSSFKSVRFTLNPSYLIYSDTYYTLNASDGKWFNHLKAIKGGSGASFTNEYKSPITPHRPIGLAARSHESKGRRSKYQRKKYLMHPSTVLLIFILIVIIICVFMAKRRKKQRITELNLFFALHF